MTAGGGRRLVVEADGGSRGNPGPAGYGALVRDAATGEVVAQRAEAIGRATNNVAEYRGLLAGLAAAAEVDPAAEVEVRMDSKLVVEQMAGRWRVKHPDLRPLALAARSAFPYDRVTWRWVPREQNTAADALANRAMDGRALPPLGPPAGPGPAGTPAPLDDVETAAALPDLGPPTVLLLLRHGETPLTAERRLSGRGGSDPGLTDRGRAQAVLAAEALLGRGVDIVVSSPLRRTQETAAVVADRLGLEVAGLDEDLAEASFGRWDGLTLAELREQAPGRLGAWLSAPDVAPPGGEALVAVDERVRRARDRLVGAHGRRTVLAVTHATPVKLLVAAALEAPLRSVLRMEAPPASLTELHVWADGTASLRAFAAVPVSTPLPTAPMA